VHHLDKEAKSEEMGPGWEYLDRLAAAMNGNAMPDLGRLLAEPSLRVRRSEVGS
jgi:hypothetical protein